jgi:hypothetical protein
MHGSPQEEPMIYPPMLSTSYTDRDRDCQLALEVQFRELIDHATKAGWKRHEAITAICNLSLNEIAADWRKDRAGPGVADRLGRVQH